MATAGGELARDEANEQIVDEQVRDLERAILKSVATERPLADTMAALCNGVSALVPSSICSVLAVDEAGRLLHLASPGLPDHYARAIDGLRIGPAAGSCGTAAYRKQSVEVTDIESDPLWADYKHFALPLGLRACWSSPITTGDGRVLGTFAFYYRTSRGPSPLERRIVSTCLYHCTIALEHEEARAEIRRLAYSDQLTGLPNRVAFQASLQDALKSAHRCNHSMAVHFLDLDGFKLVNDTLGHSVGDSLLKNVACRLKTQLDDCSFVARLGGDEFAIIQGHIQDLGQISGLAENVLSVFTAPFEIGAHKIRIGVSSGIARSPDDGTDVEQLLRKADLALYRAKTDGRRRFQLYTPEMDAALQRRRAIEQELRLSIETSGFELVFQPIVDLSTDRITSFEALLRWNRPGVGVCYPDEFIPIAEETGLIEEIGDWVLEKACTEACTWPAHVAVAVNLSLRQFRSRRFLFNLVRTLTRTGLPPHRLEVEITESVLLSIEPDVLAVLRGLADLGVRIALDDFGTGYSSLSYLRSFPFDRIKIDRTFVADLGVRRDALAIIRAVSSLARDLGMRITAEGVETKAQLDCLRDEGCTEAQGFYLSRPVAPSAVSLLLDAEEIVGRSQHTLGG